MRVYLKSLSACTYIHVRTAQCVGMLYSLEQGFVNRGCVGIIKEWNCGLIDWTGTAHRDVAITQKGKSVDWPAIHAVVKRAGSQQRNGAWFSKGKMCT